MVYLTLLPRPTAAPLLAAAAAARATVLLRVPYFDLVPRREEGVEAEDQALVAREETRDPLDHL